MYKNKINTMEDKMLPKVASNSSPNLLQLKRGWHKDAKSWLSQGVSRKTQSLCRIMIILKILLRLNLRRNCGAITN
jgi:hypothetical protein